MSTQDAANRLAKSGLISSNAMSNIVAPATKPAPAAAKPTQVAASQAVSSGDNEENFDNLDDAHAFLKKIQGEGRTGYVTSFGPGGIYGHSVRHWKL